MTRVFGFHKCSVCHRYPDTGWVYSCTQDQEVIHGEANNQHLINGKLLNDPDGILSTFKSKTNATERVELEELGLSGWIIKDIEKGLYSSQQVETMKAQKARVRDCIRAFGVRPPSPESNENTPQYNDAIHSTTLPSIDGSITRPPLNRRRESARLADFHPSEARLLPVCRWRCCFTCRPTSRERAFFSFEEVLDGTVEPAPDNNIFDRLPVHDFRLLRTIGLPKASATQKSYSIDLKSSDEETGVFRTTNPAMGDNEELEGGGEEDDESKGFRTSMKKAFKGMLDSTRKHTSSSGTATSIDSDLGHRLAAYDDEEMDEFDLGLWRKMNQAVLEDAAGTKLPGGDLETVDDEEECGFEEFGDGELEVDGGVAVTEEAVGTGVADVIMQV
ncbi:MAG: hypothetical protein M1819_000412 [Sarea resinae]|nr:MAG: hypothetical protein M1819_000412 [Sarea resinae]